MRQEEIEAGKTYSDAKGALRRVIYVSPHRDHLEYRQQSGRNAGTIRQVRLYVFAEWARQIVEV